MGLTDEELENVDWVEGNEYERVTVEVIRKVSLKILISKTQFKSQKETFVSVF